MAVDLFYQRLFELRPEFRRLFPDDLASEKRKLAALLESRVTQSATGLDDPPTAPDLGMPARDQDVAPTLRERDDTVALNVAGWTVSEVLGRLGAAENRSEERGEGKGVK